MYIILGILAFGILIFVHELGHFIAAKKLGVQVNEFAICMGPALWKKTVGETTYSIRCIPMGGYCAMEGEDSAEENPRAFTSVARWKRVIILVAGAFMNFVFGLLLLAILYGFAQGTAVPTIDHFYDGAAIAETGGLQVGDTFLEIDGEPVYLQSNVSMLMARNKTGVFDLKLLRNGQEVMLEDFSMTPQKFMVEGKEMTLYGMVFATKENSFGTTLHLAWNSALDFVRLVRFGLSDLVTGAMGIDQMSGAVGIVSVMSDVGTQAASTTDGLFNITYLAAFIAINLAVMNLLPIPALDGGRILALLITGAIETVTRKKINPKYEGYVHGAGMALLLGFTIYITFQDVFRLIG